MASSATLPTTEMTLPAKVPHTRRINKSKTCYSFLQHQQHQQQQQQQGDIELATAIGQDLLLEVKKMQVLLQEKTNALTSLALEKADALQEVDQLTSQLKQRSDTIGRICCPFSLPLLITLPSIIQKNVGRNSYGRWKSKSKNKLRLSATSNSSSSES